MKVEWLTLLLARTGLPWTVEAHPALPSTNTVALRNIDLERYDLARVVVAQGLETDDIVVTAGVQALRPGQQVRILGAAQGATP